jgi:hypothetical protein
MNRQRAVKYLNALAEHFDDQNLRLIGGDIREVVSALCAPAPDPITDLMPCGCGGKAKLYHYDVEDAFRDAFPDDYWVVFCDDCGIETGTEPTEQQAKTVWNLAMGYRG